MPAAPSPEVIGDDITISYSTDGGSTFTPFANIVDATGAKITAAEISRNILGSTAKKSQPGKPDYGDMGLTLVYARTVVTLILGWMTAKTVLNFKVDVKESGTSDSLATFLAWTKEFDPIGTVKEDDRIESKATFRITDVVTWAPGS